MVVGEAVVSQAANDAYREGYERIFGKDHKPQRGHWSFGEAEAPERAIDAPIMVDRFYENTKTVDGVDIGSRAKHRAYMKDRGLAPADDFSPGWYEAERRKTADQAKRERRETLERAFYEISNKRK